MNQNLQKISDYIQQAENLSDEEKASLAKAVKDTDSALTISEFKLERTEKVKRTTAILLEETIEELEQKRKSVEAQNRELEIETALEKVRTVAMSMRQPDDMLKVCQMISEQLQQLNVQDIRNVQTVIINEQKGTYLNYQYFTAYGKTVFEETEYNKHPKVLEMVLEMKKSADGMFSGSFEGEELNDFREYRKKDNQFPDPLLDKTISAHYCFYSIGQGGLGLSTYKPLPEPDLEIFKRFHKVFTLAYRRFIDIEKAEAQAREAEIELALERVRARTMAMQHSDELADASHLLERQVAALGLKTWSCAFHIFRENDSLEYHSNADGMKPAYVIPRTYIWQRYYEACQRGETLIIEERAGEACTELYEYMATMPIVGEELQKMKAAGISFPTYQVEHAASFKYGYLLFITFEQVPEAHAIFIRFAKVFEQTYTRFLDLQKAEAQAREEEIQLALERVRARTMAMQKSEELADVALVLFQQVKQLGIETWSTGFNVWLEEETSYIDWVVSTAEGRFMEPYTVDLTAHPFFTEISKAKKRGDDFFTIEAEGETLAETYRLLFKMAKIQFEDLVNAGFQMPDHQINHYVFGQQVSLMFITFDPCPEAHDIFKRLGKAFDQTYTRFLDLQKAETQAREAQIQLALERVRARTMAMQRSDEMAETAAILFEQFIALGEMPERMAIEIVNEAEHVFEIWATEHGGKQFNSLIKTSLDEPYVMQKMYRAWKERNKSITIDLQGNELEAYFQYLKKMKLPVDRKIFGKRRVQNVATFSKGILTIITPEPQPRETIEILERFAAVFDGTYTRFLDLQKAEAQARESQIEAALERVRSRTMAMQKTDELLDAGELLYRELSKLSIPSMTSGYVLMDEAEKIDWQYMVSPEDGSIFPEPLGVPRDETKAFRSMTASWKNLEPFNVLELNPEETIVQQTYVAEHVINFHYTAAELISFSPERLVIHTFNFKQGYLAMVGGAKLSTDQIGIMIRFARVFEQTYTRFLDLQKAEAQAREARIEATLEKVRSRTMGMQKSGELKEVIQLVYEQLVHLKINVGHAGFVVGYAPKSDWHFWIADQREIPSKITHPYFDSIWAHQFEEAIEKGIDFFATNLNFEEKNKFYQDMFKHIPGLPEASKEFYFKSAGLAGTTVLIDNIGLYIENFSGNPYSDEENKILMRFGKVFQQTYTRFNDLKKAETQAREARIEAALEKIRSRALAMRNSSEVGNVSTLLFSELEKMDINPSGFSIMIFDEKQDKYELWRAKEVAHQGAYETFSIRAMYDKLDQYVPGFSEELKSSWIEGKPFFVGEFRGKKRISFIQANREMANYSDEEFEKMKKMFPNPIFWQLVFFKYGWFGILQNKQLPEDDLLVIQRFAEVFGFAFTRFLDLQKAEAQAREAQIEAALEKVRSRSLAMHKSDELQEVVTVAFERLKDLKISMDAANIDIFSKGSRDADLWIAAPGQKYVVYFHLPYIDYLIPSSIFDAREKGDDFFAKTYSFEEKNKYFNYLFENSDFKHLPQIRKNAMLEADAYTVSFAFTKNSAISIHNYSDKSFTDEENDILKRFAKVFEQAFIRFLDLQKAEAQAREGQIEVALERVRSRSLAMHGSNELQEVVNTVFEQMKSLDIDMNVASIFIFKPGSADWEQWVATSTTNYVQQFQIPYVDLPVFRDLEEAKRKGKDFYTIKYSAEQKNEWFTYAFAHTDYREIPSERKKYILDSEFFELSFALSKHIGIQVAKYEGDDFSNEENNILKRFTRVFEQAYVRFLDLQKAEAQAREAQIEAALERVRSRTMGMQHSTELAQTALLMFEQIQNFGVHMWSCGFNIWKKEERIFTSWMSSNGVLLPPMQIPLTENIAFIHFDESRQRGDSLFVDEMSGEVLENHYRYMTTLPGIKEAFDVMADEGLTLPSYQINHLANFSNGNLMFITYEPCPQLHDIFKRFAKVFEQTYTRFLDLQKAEAQAREAVKQSSLDRVRGQIASMRTTKDLERITPIIWHELNSLDVPFIRCGVFIVDEEKSNVQVYLTTPEVKPLAVLNLSFDSNELTSNTVDHWRKGMVYREHWNKEQFIQWAQSMLGLGQIHDQETYQGSENPPETLDLHFVPFTQGMLYVGDIAPLSDEKIQLVQALADAFSIAYARYEDFNKLEKAKASIESTLTELKATQSQLIQSEKMASLGELTAGIAHEIQNPLNFVNNFSEVNTELIGEMKEELKAGKIDDAIAIANDIEENEQKINHHGKRADAIVKGMLQHSRSSNGVKEPTDINVLADEYLRLAYHGLRAKDKSFNATLKTDFDETIGKIDIIPQDIGRVILNLITNAFYAVDEKKKQQPEGYEPTVSVSTNVVIPPPAGGGQRGVKISVKDNGNGITQKVLDKIFQPFFTTKPTGQGTGLGLSMAYDIVKAHGGELEVETREGEGSVFIIRLPVK